MKKKTVIMGATDRPDRYAFRAANMLVNYGHPIVNIGQQEGTVAGEKIHTDKPMIEDVHTVTMYVGTRNQAPLYDYILSLKPKRILFNPGTENYEFEQMANKQGIQTIEGCTLVMLSVGNY